MAMLSDLTKEPSKAYFVYNTQRLIQKLEKYVNTWV